MPRRRPSKRPGCPGGLFRWEILNSWIRVAVIAKLSASQTLKNESFVFPLKWEFFVSPDQ